MSSRVWFLQQCINLKIIPPTLQLRSNCKLNTASSVTVENFVNNLQEASLNNVKLCIKEERLFLKHCKSEFKSSKNNLHCEIKEPFLHAFLEERLLKEKLSFSKQFRNKHKNKLIFLLKKNERPVPLYLSNDVQSPRNNKRRRKFVKRSKFRRRMRKIQKSAFPPLVNNYSDIELTSPMTSLLNKGLCWVSRRKTRFAKYVCILNK